MHTRKVLLVTLMTLLVLTPAFIHSAPSQSEETPLIISPGLDGIATVTPEYDVFVDPSYIVDADVAYTDAVRLWCPVGYKDEIGIANLTLNPDQITELQIFVTYFTIKRILLYYLNGSIIQNQTFTLYAETEAMMGISISSPVAQGPIDPITYDIICSYGLPTIHDIAITGIELSETEEYVGRTVNITVNVANLGTETETFDVTAYYGCGGIAIGTQTITDLAYETSTTLTFNWDTTNVRPFARVPYTIWAIASTVPNEANLTNNEYIDGTVKIKMMGDVNGDGEVDIFDVVLVASAYETEPGDPNWNPEADLVPDEKIDIYDVVKVTSNYEKTDEIIEIIDHIVTVDGRTFLVVTNSNATVTDFAFSQKYKEISFDTTGICGTTSYCRVAFPTELLGAPFTVLLDGEEAPFVMGGNLTHTIVLLQEIEFPPATRKVQIIGTTVASETFTNLEEHSNGLCALALLNDET